jgi:anti-anti-sigma regulatory factor
MKCIWIVPIFLASTSLLAGDMSAVFGSKGAEEAVLDIQQVQHMVSVFHQTLLSYFNSSNSVGQIYIRAIETLDSYTICNFFP